ncbi:MAG TPA: diguanylate cyclase [Terriglobales bacterium]|nr:diguanylate cyclase [Terriglobales bacterium]
MATQVKNPIFQFGIRQKVVLVLVTVLLSALTVSGWLALEQEKVDAIREIQQRGSDITRFVAKSLAYSVVGYDYHTIQLLLDEITVSDIVSYAEVINSNGNVMAEAGKRRTPNSPKLLMFTNDIEINHDVVGTLIIGISTANTMQRLDSQKFHLVEREAAIIFLIAVGEFLALSFLIIRPVSVMSAALRDGVKENGEAVGQLPVMSNDEFGDLAREFNAISSRLNEANSRLRSKVISADEQLRATNEKLLQQSSELQRINEEFKRLSVTDSLTGLFNRRYFESMIEAEVSASMRYGDPNSLLLFDVDHFKKINDTYGHAAGDMVLREIAQRLKDKMRSSDTLCRVGGEEFAAFCKNADRDDALSIADKLRQTVLASKFKIGDELLDVTVSVGVATVPDVSRTSTAKDFYRCADIALYQSKGAGRNRVTHYSHCAGINRRA